MLFICLIISGFIIILATALLASALILADDLYDTSATRKEIRELRGFIKNLKKAARILILAAIIIAIIGVLKMY